MRKYIAAFVPERLAVGLSTIVGVTVLAGQVSVSMEMLSGQTLEIVAAPGASVGWGQGFPFPTNAIMSFDSIGTMWLAASGATALVVVLRGRSEGFEP